MWVGVDVWVGVGGCVGGCGGMCVGGGGGMLVGWYLHAYLRDLVFVRNS